MRREERPALLLDVMGTLVHDPFYDEVPRALGLAFDELLRVKHPSAWIEFELGDLEEHEFLDRFFADGRAYDRAALRRGFADAYRLLPGIEELLHDLAARGIRPHLLSNYPEWWQLVEARTGLSRWCEWSFVSCRTRLRKPDPEAFLRAARELDRAPGDCLFVDDAPRNVEGAARVGLKALRFRDAATLRDDLVRHGLLAGGR